MASILVEDGTGVIGANSYASVDYASEYFDEMGNYAWDEIGEQDKMLIVATRYINNRFGHLFRGTPEFVEEDVLYLPFPRLYINNYVGVPICLKQATCEYALRAGVATTPGMAAIAPDPGSSTGQVSYTRKKIGPMEKEIHYAIGSTANTLPAFPAYPYADALLRPLLRVGGGVIR